MSPDEARNRYAYRTRCGGCHGPNGEGAGEMGPEIRSRLARLNEAALKKRILQGGTRMPAFNGKIRDPEITWLLSHLRRLGGR